MMRGSVKYDGVLRGGRGGGQNLGFQYDVICRWPLRNHWSKEYKCFFIYSLNLEKKISVFFHGYFLVFTHGVYNFFHVHFFVFSRT